MNSFSGTAARLAGVQRQIVGNHGDAAHAAPVRILTLRRLYNAAMVQGYKIAADEREALIAKLAEALAHRHDLAFAILFGSFVAAPSFRDIDIGIWTAAPTAAR